MNELQAFNHDARNAAARLFDVGLGAVNYDRLLDAAKAQHEEGAGVANAILTFTLKVSVNDGGSLRGKATIRAKEQGNLLLNRSETITGIINSEVK